MNTLFENKEIILYPKALSTPQYRIDLNKNLFQILEQGLNIPLQSHQININDPSQSFSFQADNKHHQYQIEIRRLTNNNHKYRFYAEVKHYTKRIFQQHLLESKHYFYIE